MSAFEAPGVYALDPRGRPVLIKAIDEDSYEDWELADVVQLFGRGRLEHDGPDRRVLILKRVEIDKLKLDADAQSFDHDPGLIELCLAIWHFAGANPSEEYRFVEVA